MFQKMTAALLALTLLNACSIKAKTDGGDAGPQAQTFENAVPGPKLDGHYVSQCEADKWDNDYLIFDRTVKDATISQTETHFTDSRCTIANPAIKTAQRNGVFRFTKNLGSDIYEVEYRYNMPHGTYTTGDNIRLTNGTLWISDRHLGALSVPDIALHVVQP